MTAPIVADNPHKEQKLSMHGIQGPIQYRPKAKKRPRKGIFRRMLRSVIYQLQILYLQLKYDIDGIPIRFANSDTAAILMCHDIEFLRRTGPTTIEARIKPYVREQPDTYPRIIGNSEIPLPRISKRGTAVPIIVKHGSGPKGDSLEMVRLIRDRNFHVYIMSEAAVKEYPTGHTWYKEDDPYGTIIYNKETRRRLWNAALDIDIQYGIYRDTGYFPHCYPLIENDCPIH